MRLFVTGASVKPRLLRIACVAVLCGILTAGLWPFHSPRNGVAWLQGRNGVRVGPFGTVMSRGIFTSTQAGGPQPCSIELWLEPAAENGGTLLSFYAPDNPLRLALIQTRTDLVLQSVTPISANQVRVQRIAVSDVVREKIPVFVTVTSGRQGTALYVNGALPIFETNTSAVPGKAVHVSGTLPGMTEGSPVMPCNCTGRLIVGDAARPHGAWSGDIRGLAIYASELPAPTVRRHYHTWTNAGTPDLTAQDHAETLYLFGERAGDVVHNFINSGFDLLIPYSYTVLEKPFLHPDWDEFSMSWGYWWNNFENIAGFVPFGFCFCAYFAQIQRNRRSELITVIFGFGVSLMIEILQGFLPTRDSGTTDLVTNTLGTGIGVMLYRAGSVRLAGWANVLIDSITLVDG